MKTSQSTPPQSVEARHLQTSKIRFRHLMTAHHRLHTRMLVYHTQSYEASQTLLLNSTAMERRCPLPLASVYPQRARECQCLTLQVHVSTLLGHYPLRSGISSIWLTHTLLLSLNHLLSLSVTLFHAICCITSYHTLHNVQEVILVVNYTGLASWSGLTCPEVSSVGSSSVVLLDARLPSDISLCTSSSFSASVFPETIVEPIRSAPR
jgi:hypothetical protein